MMREILSVSFDSTFIHLRRIFTTQSVFWNKISPTSSITASLRWTVKTCHWLRPEY